MCPSHHALKTRGRHPGRQTCRRPSRGDKTRLRRTGEQTGRGGGAVCPSHHALNFLPPHWLLPVVPPCLRLWIRPVCPPVDAPRVLPLPAVPVLRPQGAPCPQACFPVRLRQVSLLLAAGMGTAKHNSSGNKNSPDFCMQECRTFLGKHG